MLTGREEHGMNIKQGNVLPLFSSPVYVSTIEDNLDGVFESIKKLKYIEANYCGTYISENKDVLSKFPFLKNALFREFNSFKNSCLHYKHTEFFMTTSWATKCSPNARGHRHNHMNCLYSGVLYFQEGKDFGSIRFSNENLIPRQIQLKEPTEWNILNSNTWMLESIPNKVIIFPSYLLHEITFHCGNEDRYSLAFNFFPKGVLGESDSFIDFDKQYRI
tara:strand:- start:65 stop:721 length:657 start_codon:yes stop_codon:yes gene_type:complete